MAGKQPAIRLDPEFGVWLAGTRRGLGMTATGFAEATGLSTSTIQSMEGTHKATGGFSVALFQRLADALNLDLGYVLYKAGVNLGSEGVNVARMKRVEEAVDALAQEAPALRKALAEALRVLPDIQPDLARGLVALDVLTERLRNESPLQARRREATGLWERRELDFLVHNAHMDHTEVARRLGRSVEAVRNQRRRLVTEGATA